MISFVSTTIIAGHDTETIPRLAGLFRSKSASGRIAPVTVFGEPRYVVSLLHGNYTTDGRATLLDLMPWMTAGLAKLKHEVTVGDAIAPNAINVMVDNFVDADEQVVKDYDFKFGLIATQDS